MSAPIINKPFPHCVIPYGHPCYRGFVPSDYTDIRQTWDKAQAYFAPARTAERKAA